MFLHLSVILLTGGHVWLLPVGGGGKHDLFRGACMVLFGRHAWFYLGGHAWFYLGGMHGFIWGGMHGFIWGGACMVFSVFQIQ